MSPLVLRTSVIGASSIVLLGAAVQLRGQQLPGSAGPRVEILKKTAAGVEVSDVSVESRDPASKSGEPLRVLPTGTKQMSFIIRTKGLPAEGTKFGVEIMNQAGPVKREGYQSFVQITDPKTGEATFMLSPPSDKPYPDGPYRATVTIADVRVAVLNWSIGPAATPGRPKP